MEFSTMSVYVYLDLLQVNRIDPQFRLVSRGCTQEWGAAGARQRGQGGPAVRRRPVSTFAVTCDGSTSDLQWPVQKSALEVPTITSSTAQGGGGSFKNRKPIGEVGCCESGMAERSHWLTERWLELCLVEWLQWLQWSPHPQLLDVVWCTATVVVVVAYWSCSCGVM